MAATESHVDHRTTKTTPTADRSTAVMDAATEIRGVIEGAGRSVPALARTTRNAAVDLYRTIDAGSDERVSAGVTLSLGLAVGMLIGGAPRLLIALALVPLAITGFVMADRRTRITSRSA
jgi:hypothetical protein